MVRTKVYLAVGHGHRDDGTFDPGAVGGGWSEQTAGDHIVAEAARLLRTAGLTVFDEAFRNDPNFPGTTRTANSLDVDVVVSIHHDWTGAPPGAFGHWYTSAGRTVADAIQREVGAAGFPLRPSWHKRRTDLFLLKRTEAPACLYEVGKIGQPELDSPAKLRKMGRAVAAGVAAWADVELPTDDEGLDMDASELRQIVREEVDAALDGRDYGNDMGRLRRSVRAIGAKVGLATEYPPPDQVDA